MEGEMKKSLFLVFAYMMASNMCAKNTDTDKNVNLKKQRLMMVENQIRDRGIQNPRVLEAMRNVPRHKFVDLEYQKSAYEDHPLPIGHGQTISQPYIVAYMTEKLALTDDDKVLEIGTGSGYQAAILAELADSVYTIEIVEPLCVKAKKRLADLGYDNVFVRCGNGYNGWPEEAPFDAVIMTAAGKHIPQPLLDQLKVGGQLVAPVGDYFQELVLMKKTDDDQFKKEKLIPVRFVPLTGKQSK
jgi:protein-L-isoaspartate(D-aspartate) O-methyltransferase